MPQSSGYRSNSIKFKKIRSSKYSVNKKKTLSIYNQQYTKYFILFLLSFCSFLFFSVFFINKNLNKSFVYADSDSSINSDFYNFSYISIHQDPKTDYININKISFVLVDKITKKTLILNFPIEYKTNLGTRYSDIPLNQLINISGIKNKDKLYSGVNEVNNQIFKILGFKPNNFIIIDSSISSSFEELMYKGDTNFILSNLLKIYKESNLKSNFNMLQLISIQNDLNNRVSQDTKIVDITLENINKLSYLDSFFDIVSLSSPLAKEKKTISVLNGTNVSGVAGFGSRVINNSGGRVVFVDNASNFYENSVLISDDLDSETSKYLIKTFNISKVYTKSQVPLSQEDSFKRSDITLILGVDFITETY